MPRSRSLPPAAAPTGSGCLSGLWLPPLAALLIGLLLAGLAPARAQQPAAQAAEPIPAAAAPAAIAALFTPEVQHWAAWNAEQAAQAGLDAQLAATVMQIESCGDPRAQSPVGAAGLFQVMPGHFPSGEDRFDPATNARRGLDYLRRGLILAGGDVRLALAGYNGGHSQIGRPEGQWPAETRRYVYWGAGIHADAAAGRETSPRLDEWLAAGGSSLCWQAHTRLGLP